MMDNTAAILKRLIEKGNINDREDNDLFVYLSDPQTQDDLQVFAEEWSFYLLKRQHDIYLIPKQDNELLSMKLADLRTAIGSNKRNADAYLQCYIIMVILWMIFKNKNGIEDYAHSLRIKDIVETLDERFLTDETSELLETNGISYRNISDKWNYSAVEEDGSRKSKMELVRTACRFLENNKLCRMYDDEDEVRPLQRLIDLMYGYYLKENRIEEINRLFEKVDENAGYKQD